MSPIAADMAAAMEGLIAALPAEHHSRLRLRFDDPARCHWRYTPGERPGISVAEMDRAAGKAVHNLLATAISRPAHAQVTAIAGLEDVLDESEGGRLGRHAGDYWAAVFGDPGAGPWGWRFEGHHVSINLTVAGEAVCATPCFLGVHPATLADDGGRTVSRPLAPEEDVAATLMASLDDEQRNRAVVSRSAPGDILSEQAVEIAEAEDRAWRKGLPAQALRPDQVWMLRNVAAIYINRLVGELAEPLLTQLDKDLPAFSFSWAGAPNAAPGQPHYYRVEGPRFLVEFDNRQNHANHVHSVWRDPGGDFGARLL